MWKLGKKGRNPGAIDNWLDNLGLYRKNVAYDETCLFRAISEQLFDCQVYHERVRRECLKFARENYIEFSGNFKSVDEYFDHLEKLEKHMVVCGDVELKIISKKYKRNITIFDASDQQVYHLQDEDFDETFLLCLMDKDHYDVIYKKEHIMTAGFCQSIVYKVLYENVFKIPNVDEIVHNMLYDKGNIITQAELMMEKKRILQESGNKEMTNEEVEEKLLENKAVSVNIAPFPFKIAKALDPHIYRNIEYDSWGEMRREWRLGEWYYGDNKLILGTKCIYSDITVNEKFDCYIQEIIKDKNMCVVYLTKLAEKRTVRYTDLSPEDDAKPWPLPYRFSKSLVISPTTPPADKNGIKPRKRNKEKKRTKSESSVHSSNAPIKQEPLIENVDAYVGIPLHMHNPNNTDNANFENSEVSTETQTDPIVKQETTTHATQENEIGENSRWYPNNGYQWPSYVPQNIDPFVWPPSPAANQNVFNYNVKPMVASAPVTPSVIPYHDLNYPYYYNYHVESYPNYPQWSAPPFELQLPPKNQQKREQEISDVNHNTQQEVQHQIVPKQEVNNNYEIQNHINTPEVTVPNYPPPEPPLNYVQHCTPCTPIEMYPTMSPVVQMAPVQPVYTTGPEMTEAVMPTPPMIYTPPVEMHYVQPTQFIYPPTPPATWYPAGITAQGFIFPQRH